MTLILALTASDGIVLASDGQITHGMVRSTGKKIRGLGGTCLWAAAGELALIQRVEERLLVVPRTGSLRQVRDFISEVVCQCVSELLKLDFRSGFCGQDANQLLNLHPADFVFTEVTESQGPLVLHVCHNGTSEWIIDRPFATGSGDMFAYALLRKYHGVKLNLSQASLLAYEVLEEAIEVGAYGLGYPIDVWHVNKDSLRQLSEAEIAALQDQSAQIREMEVKLLVGDSGRITAELNTDDSTMKTDGLEFQHNMRDIHPCEAASHDQQV